MKIKMNSKTSKLTTENTIAEASPLSMLKKREDSRLDHILAYLPFTSKRRKPVVAVLRLSGTIGKGGGLKSGLNLDNLNEIIEKAFKTPKLTAVCLSINSPGGSPVQSELIAKRIRTLADENNIPVYSFIEDVGASGGYWLACAGDKIYASKSSIIGSIGVISSSFGFQDAIEKLGIERRIYTQGKNKSVLDPFMPTKSNDVKLIKQLQKQIHDHFIDYVKTRRAGKLTQDDEVLFNGEFWAGMNALDFGLIDGIDDMYNFLTQQFGADVKIEYMAAKQPWLKRKLGMVSHNLAEDFTESLTHKLENKLVQNRFNLE
jgi:signal peptide peptidase SppA